MTGDRRPLPTGVKFTKPTVAVAVGVDGPILLPEQSQRHPFPAKLTVDKSPIRLRIAALHISGRAWKQQPLQVAVGKIVG